MINLQGSSINLQGGNSSNLSLPTSTPQPSIQQPQQQTAPAPTTPTVSTSQQTIPQYISRDQARMLLQAAKDKGIDPATALKSLITQGHIIEGVNDQNMQTQNVQPTPQQLPSHMGVAAGVANAVGNTGIGIVKGTGQVFNNVAQPIANFFSNLFGVSQQNIDANTQFNEQSYTPKGTSQKVGAVIGKTLPAVGAGLAGQAELAGPIMAATGASPLVAGSVAQGLGAGAEAFLGTKGSVGERAKAGLTQGIVQGVFNYGLGKLFPILGLGGGEYTNTKAYNEAIKAVKGLGNLQTAINGETMNFASLADEAGAQVPISSGLKSSLDEAATKYGLSLPKALNATTSSIRGEVFNNGLANEGTSLLPSEVQQTIFQLSKKASIPEINGLMDQLSNTTVNALNAHAPGLGDEFGQLYENWNTRSAILKPALQIFKSNGAPGPELQADITRASNLANGPAGKQITQALVKNIKDLGGPDLSSTFNAAKAISQISNSALKQHAISFLKGIGLLTAGAIGGQKLQQILGAIGL